MAPAFPGQYNTFIPDHAATGRLVVDFSRNPSDFPLPRWWQYVNVTKNQGRYIKMTVEMAGRVLSATGQDAYWPDNAPRPSNNEKTESFEYQPVRTDRYEDGFNLGDLAASQADWDVVAQHARITAQRCMTRRSLIGTNLALTATQYPAAHRITDVTSLAGVTGKLDVSTVDRSDIKRVFDHAADLIRKETLSAVKPDQLMVVVGPEFARRIAATNEIRSYIQQHEGAYKYVEGNLGPHNNYGLPERLYDYNIVVEDTVRVSTRKGETTVKGYIFDGDTILMGARVGGLEGIEGAPSFSTWSCFFKEEMTVETKHDTDNRRHQGSIVEDYEMVVTSPSTGVHITDVLT